MRNLLFLLTILTLLSGVFGCDFFTPGDSETEPKTDTDQHSTVIVEPTITDVILAKFPNKTEYLFGETLSVEGAKLEVEWSDGEKEEIAVGNLLLHILLPDIQCLQKSQSRMCDERLKA